MAMRYRCILWVFLTAFCQVVHAEKIEYTNDFARFLHIPGKGATAEVICPRDHGILGVRAGNVRITGEGAVVERFRDYRNLKDRGLSDKFIYQITYGIVGGSSRFSKIGFLTEISKSHIRFSLADETLEINLELTDPQIPLIMRDKLPESRYILEDLEDGGEGVTVPKAVYVWENDNVSEKMICNIITTWPDLRDWGPNG
jgi:hypothetical protein